MNYLENSKFMAAFFALLAAVFMFNGLSLGYEGGWAKFFQLLSGGCFIAWMPMAGLLLIDIIKDIKDDENKLR